VKNLRSELGTWVQALVFTGVWVILIAVTHQKLVIDWDAVKEIPHAVVLYGFLYLLFAKWAWRLPVFHPWLVPHPDLEGTWDGEVRSTWTNPATGAGIPPIPSKLVIKHKFSSISCVLLTGESRSDSVTAQINDDDDSNVLQLSYVYTNKPRARVRFRSEIHDGAAILTIKEENGLVLEGEYWTGRKTTGEMMFRRVSRRTSLPVMSEDAHPVNMTDAGRAHRNRS
jgi:SMODS-associating 2TM, beta-strand rich effector domain